VTVSFGLMFLKVPVFHFFPPGCVVELEPIYAL
jgi:hypothetical protein